MNTTTAAQDGLSAQQAQSQRAKFGSNEIYKPESISVWAIAREELRDPFILLLIFTGVIYSLFGELRDAVTIFVIIALLIGSEVLTESRATKAIAALEKITAVKTRVKRDHQIVEIDTLDVVPDDVLILSSGTKIAADARIQASTAKGPTRRLPLPNLTLLDSSSEFALADRRR